MSICTVIRCYCIIPVSRSSLNVRLLGFPQFPPEHFLKICKARRADPGAFVFCCVTLMQIAVTLAESCPAEFTVIVIPCLRPGGVGDSHQFFAGKYFSCPCKRQSFFLVISFPHFLQKGKRRSGFHHSSWGKLHIFDLLNHAVYSPNYSFSLSASSSPTILSSRGKYLSSIR